ncbi:MAG: DUF805 domain-containing protein [Pseudolabrys sp.]|nr:DUF805 domain-containing protein [Pseudolabrys sp.]
MDFSNPKELLFTFDGRINRGRYWTAVVIAIVYMIALFVLGMLIGFLGMLGLIVIFLLYIPMILAGIAVGIKRLHDRDKSGWWLLAFYLGPALLTWLGGVLNAPFIFSLASLAVSIWAIVELGFLAGTPGPNQYGPEPA